MLKMDTDAKEGYFLISVTPATLNKTIQYAAASGIKYITFLDNIWDNNGGHYNFSQTIWKGMAGASVVSPALAQFPIKLRDSLKWSSSWLNNPSNYFRA